MKVIFKIVATLSMCLFLTSCATIMIEKALNMQSTGPDIEKVAPFVGESAESKYFFNLLKTYDRK